MTLSKKKQVQAADDDNVYHIYRKKKVPDLLILPKIRKQSQWQSQLQ